MKSELGEWRVVSYLLLTFFVLLNNSPAYICAQQSGKVYIYSFPKSHSSEILLRYFCNRSDWEVIFYNLNDSSSLERFFKIVGIFRVLGIEVLPPGVCLMCDLRYSTWNDIWTIYASPLIGVIRNGRLTAITVGITNQETLDRSLIVNAEYVKVFTHHDTYALSDEGVKVQLEELFVGQDGRTERNVSNLISSIVFLALSDSVNPCTFAVFTALLFISLYSFGKMKTATVGFSFILAIFIGYYALGFGVFQIFAAISNVNKALAFVGLVMGTFSIITGLEPRFKSPIPKSIKRMKLLQINKSYSPIASFVLGLVATFTLLPCSSGPYLVGLGLISALRDAIQAYLLLILYNIIFVTPLIIILLAVLASGRLSRKIKAFRSTKLGVMQLISGILLAIVCTYLLLS